MEKEPKKHMVFIKEERELSKPIREKLLELYKLKELQIMITTPQMTVKIVPSKDTEEEKLLKKQLSDLWKKYYKVILFTND